MNAYELIAKILKREGVEQLTCFPNNAVIEAAAKEGIRPIMFRHERGAIMAADGFSRMSAGQRFGVVATQNAAGAENSLGGLSQAFADNIPILMLPGGYALEERQVRPNFGAVENYRGVVKSVESIDSPGQTSDVMRRAFQALRNGRGGPVVVELTSDVCSQDVPEARHEYQSPSRAETVPSKSAIQRAVAALLSAERPLIWAGAGVLMSGATASLKELSELLDLPVHTTMEGKSAIDERHPLALGAGSGATTAAAHRFITESDLILALGSSLSNNHYTQSVPSGRTVIHNTISSDDVNKDTPSDIALVGDARLTIELLIEEAKSQTNGSGRSKGTGADIAAIKADWLSDWNALLESDEVPLGTYRVIHEINENIDPENSTVTHDAGAPRDSMVPFFVATNPHSYIGWGKTTHLGFGIPLMIGAKLAAPDRFCLNMMGDAAFGMSGLDIETSVRSGLPITTVILNNGGMATYPEGNIPEARKRFGVTFMQGSYAQIAEGMGATGIVVKKVEEMGPAILRARELNASGTTVLIDVHSNMEPRRSRF